MNTAPKGLRLHIGIFGRRNVGKSSLLNAMVRQQVSIVSPVAGTTTDPVEKPMELLPLGPVLFLDTAGIDDSDALGALRVLKTRQVLERTELAILVAECGAWTSFEDALLAEFAARKIPYLVAFNKCDLRGGEDVPEKVTARLQAEKVKALRVSATTGEGLDALRAALLELAPPEFIDSPAIAGDLVGPGELAVLVVPIDKEARRGD